MRKALRAIVVVGVLAFLGSARVAADEQKGGKAEVEWQKGAKADVEWSGAWYKAVVLETDGAKVKIHYDGWEDSWDEWVTPERIRPGADWKVGDKLEVEWKSAWYAAEILSIEGEQYRIHYTGWGKEWDEPVGKKRMRCAPAAK